MKEFIRFQYKKTSLSAMRKKAEREFGLCCYRLEDKDKLLNEFLPQTLEDGDKGFIYIFEGEVWGLCPEGYKAFPKKILSVEKGIAHKKCVRPGLFEFKFEFKEV